MKTQNLGQLSEALNGAQNVLSLLRYGHNKHGHRVLMLPADGPEIAAINALLAKLEACADSVSDQISQLS